MNALLPFSAHIDVLSEVFINSSDEGRSSLQSASSQTSRVSLGGSVMGRDLDCTLKSLSFVVVNKLWNTVSLCLLVFK